MKIRPAHGARDIALVGTLFREYAADSNLDLCFQNFEEELARLPGEYDAPEGSLFLAESDEQTAGCVALRKFSGNICEMKRLFVRSSFRGVGVGRQLASTIIQSGQELGYTRMRLDTLARMTAALTLYESLGFRRIEAYRPNPLPDVVYLELEL